MMKLILSSALLLFVHSSLFAQCGATSVDVDPQPIMICEGSSDVVNFTANGTCSGNYEFEVLSGAVVVQNWSTSTTFSAAPTTTTTYTVNARCSACPATIATNTFTVDVVPEPTVAGALTVCPGGTTTLTGSGSTNITWVDAPVGGAQLSATDTYTTPALSTDETYYVQSSGSISGVGGSILITECGLEGAIGGTGSEDYIEISNLYSTAVNTTGWVVAVSSSYTNVNSFNATLWNLPSSFAPCSMVSRTDNNSSSNYWGNNILWNPNSNSWAIIIDDMGNVVDFVAWGWTAAELAAFNPTINGFSITLGPQWIGDGCPAACSTTGGIQYSLARTGSADSNTNADFICQATSVDQVNPGLNCGWTAGVTCPYPITVTVSPSQDATITPVGPFCSADPSIVMTAVDGGGTWSGTGIVNATTGEFDPVIAGAGTHTITYMIPGLCGDTQTFDVVVTDVFDATIDAVGPICQLDPAMILTAANAGGTWSGNGITNVASGEFTPGVAGAGTHTITYTIGGACGDIQTMDIVVDQLLDATITPVGPYCFNDPSVTLTAVDAGGTWSGTGITNATTGAFDPMTAGVGTHTVTYAIPGACGDTKTLDIVVNTQLDATITPVGPYCESDPSITMTAVDPGGVWSGNGITNANYGDFDPAVAGVGIHTITYEIAGACGDIQTIDVEVIAEDDATITQVGPFCLGAPVETLVGVTAGGTWSGPGITNAATGEFSATNAGPGVHTITYSTNGFCPDTKTTTIEVYQPLQVQAFSNDTICDNESIDITAQGSGGDGNLTYTWTDQTGAAVGTGNVVNVAPQYTTTYTVTLSDGCTTPTVSSSIEIVVYPVPSVNFTADVTEGCAPLEVNFTNLSNPIGTECNWDFGDGNNSNDILLTENEFNVDGCFDVTLTVTQDGCTNSLTMASMICVSNQTNAEFLVTPSEVDIWDPTFQFTNTSTNADYYVWNFGDSTTSNEVDPMHEYPAQVAGYSVCLLAWNEYCVDSICSAVNVIDEPLYYVPNTFTPDGDEFNQSFKPIFTSGFDPYDYNFLIFNRWGEVIWESNDASVGWDGTYNGKVIAAGTYVWKVEFKTSQSDKRIMDTGHISLMK